MTGTESGHCGLSVKGSLLNADVVFVLIPANLTLPSPRTPQSQVRIAKSSAPPSQSAFSSQGHSSTGKKANWGWEGGSQRHAHRSAALQATPIRPLAPCYSTWVLLLAATQLSWPGCSNQQVSVSEAAPGSVNLTIYFYSALSP